MILIDYLVVGGGIAGASVAYFLKKGGAKVAIIDDTGFGAAASLAAGAFINPVMGKPSKFKDFADEAFRFSVAFYLENFPELFNRCGSLIYPKNEKTKEEFAALGSYIPSSYELLQTPPFESLAKEAFSLGAYLVKDSGIINPKALIEAMLENIDRYDICADKLEFDGASYIVGDIRAKNIILAQGAKEPIIKEPYLSAQLASLWGQKIKTKADIPDSFNLSSKVHIASSNGVLAIGATHVNAKESLPIDRETSLALINEAGETLNIGDFEIIEEVGGMRSTSIDHFPLAGGVCDSAKTIERFPSLIHGARLSKEEPIKHKNLYIHTGHGSRAFILAPFTAWVLARHLLDGKPIPRSVDPARLLFRYFKKRLL